jgi:hypothetical protein
LNSRNRSCALGIEEIPRDVRIPSINAPAQLSFQHVSALARRAQRKTFWLERNPLPVKHDRIKIEFDACGTQKRVFFSVFFPTKAQPARYQRKRKKATINA